MAYLSPKIVSGSARSLFGQAYSHIFAFLMLKAAGINQHRAINIKSTKASGPGFQILAEQPLGFDGLVDSHKAKFSDTNYAFPSGLSGTSKPGSTYTLYFPVTNDASSLIRKSDSWRSVVWTQMSKLDNEDYLTGNNLLPNRDKRHIYELSDFIKGQGGNIKLVPGYEEAARWNFGLPGKPLHIPLHEFAVWVHRNEDLDPTTTIDQLVN